MKSSSFDVNFLPIPTIKFKKYGVSSARWHRAEKSSTVMPIRLQELYLFNILVRTWQMNVSQASFDERTVLTYSTSPSPFPRVSSNPSRLVAHWIWFLPSIALPTLLSVASSTNRSGIFDSKSFHKCPRPHCWAAKRKSSKPDMLRGSAPWFDTLLVDVCADAIA